MNAPTVRQDQRIVGLDLARAFALFGMVVVNFKIAMGAESGPSWLKFATGLLEGRAAATFVVLAGIGISLLSSRARASGDSSRLTRDRSSLLKRALFLFIAGLLYSPIWPADILHFYGIYIAVAALLLGARSSVLWAGAAALISTFGVLLLVLDYERGWNFDTLTYTDFWTPAGMVRHLFFNGFHPVVPWLAFMLIGMAIGRLDLLNPKIRRRLFLWGAGIAAWAEATSWTLIHFLSQGANSVDQEAIAAVFGTAPMPPAPLYMLAGAGTACSIIALAVAMGQSYTDSPWLRPLIATGQLALTLYVAHVLVGLVGLDLIGRLENQTLPFSVFASAIFCSAAVVFAHGWRKRFKRGPLETLMRALT